MEFLHEYLVGRFPQDGSIFRRKCPIANFYEIIVKGSVGTFWRADGHNREVQVIDGTGRDRRGHRGLLPLLVGFADQQSCSKETEADDDKPENFEGPSLKCRVKKGQRKKRNCLMCVQ